MFLESNVADLNVSSVKFVSLLIATRRQTIVLLLGQRKRLCAFKEVTCDH